VVAAATAELKDRLRRELGGRLRSIAVFGSAARGEMSEDSDVDVLVVLDRIDGHRDRVVAIEAAHDAGFARGLVVQALVLGQAELDLLRQRETGLAEELDRDGIEV
jgi:predicted nucleotidyltransferase